MSGTTLRRGMAAIGIAAACAAARTLRLRLKPALYRVEVRVALANGRLSAPTRRWLRVLTPAGR